MSDYKNTLVVGKNDRKTFNAKTTWYGTGLTKVDYLIIDEMSAMDWNYIQFLAAFLSAKCVLLVGDSKQTVLIPGREGVDPINKLSGIVWDDVPTHELVKNFRLDAWRVKLLNKIYDYSMVPVRNDALPPKFLSKSEYDEYKTCNTIEREMFFSHSSAIEIFGCNSSPDREDGTNMSVRSCQGKTYKKGSGTVSCSELDSSTIDVHGMSNVAVSRSKNQIYFVYKDSCENDPVVSKVKRLLYLENESTIRTISEETLPEIEEIENKWSMTQEQKDFNLAIQNKIENSEVYTDDLRSTVNVDGLEFPQILTMEFIGYGDVNNSIKYLFEFYRTQFNFCIIDAIKSSDLKENVDEDLIPILRSIYECDELMGRTLDSGFINFNTKRKPLKTVEGKRLLPIQPFVKMLETKGYSVEFFSNFIKEQKLIYYTKDLSVQFIKPLFFSLSNEHIEVRPVQEVKIYDDEHSKEIKFVMKENTPVPEYGYFLRMMRQIIQWVD
ncbi:hypothetical protein G6F37_012659 [Rhizopus arrhizus]|nr:hypothetical protein G6F38_012126 [Rhizopus arrhizus]KAG1142338.1 hypothetical protein G6F37_012659 [Rhizopus arrhizus]